MKTTLEIPDPLFRQTKATAAYRGESLKDLVADALRAYLERLGSPAPRQSGWRSVFGQASATAVGEVDAVIAEEFERIDPADWQ